MLIFLARFSVFMSSIPLKQHSLPSSVPTVFTEVQYADAWISRTQHAENFLFVGDIGGTNSNFGIIEKKKDGTLQLCVSFHAKSQHVENYQQLLQKILTHIQSSFHLTITRSCWGVAGLITDKRSYARPTNLPMTLQASAIRHNNSLDELIFMNDFEAVGLGIESLSRHSILPIAAGTPIPLQQKGYIGAGTGLGKGGLLWNHSAQIYFPVLSEGGHADFAAQSEQEYDLCKFIQSRRTPAWPVSWEDVLSGNGIATIYHFLGTQKVYPTTPIGLEIEQTNFKPDLISHYAQQDSRCFDTFVLYTALYARCAKNFALDMLTRNGMYIAGGIAAKNISIFKSEQFHAAFYTGGKQQELLRTIPLFVIADYNVNLYGAARFLLLRDEGLIA